MGKIVKYCNACEEGFAEKFGFCPNCGAQLTAFEMNPIVAAQTVQETPAPAKTEELLPPVNVFETKEEIVVKPLNETKAPEPKSVESINVLPVTESFETKDAFELDDEVFEDKTEEYVMPETAEIKEEFAVPVTSAPETYQATYQNVSSNQKSNTKFDDGFHVTIVREKNVKQRNLLLLGFFILFFSAFGVGVVYSMFNKYLEVGAIETDKLGVFVGEVEPVATTPEEEEIIRSNKKDGGGGGGNEDPNPASKGRYADQSDNPLFKPSVTYTKLTDPTIKIKPTTLGNRKTPDSDEPYGLPDGVDGPLSDGPGKRGGQGTGENGGQGMNVGGGRGPGNNGGGGGGGNGPTGGNTDPLETLQVKKPPVGPTVGVKILSKPRPSYTDSARINNVQGTVVLKVTFLASGQVGGVSVIKGLPNGLTEQAIAAAKAIRFEPAKKGGQPYSVTKQVDYSFTIF